MQTTYSSPQETLRAYLPATLVERWARQPQQPHLWGEWLTGSLMFCDISGFTAMSEALTRLGKEGAELMAGVLNRFFETMLAIADGWGGTQMKFGGDVSIAAGPLGKTLEASTTTNLEADVYSFGKTAGLFGGVSFEGAGILKRDSWNEGYYGAGATPYAIVIERKFTNPNTQALRDALAPY